MSYNEEQLNDALSSVRNRFFMSVGLAALVGAAGLYVLGEPKSAELSPSTLLFSGFIVGFFVAGIVITKGVRAELKKQKK